MYPPLPFLFRICTKEYIIPDTNIVIEKGTRVIFPIFGIHRDPNIHSDPKQFKPERFSRENKAKMHPFANLAFGEGPRICIGIFLIKKNDFSRLIIDVHILEKIF